MTEQKSAYSLHDVLSNLGRVRIILGPGAPGFLKITGVTSNKVHVNVLSLDVLLNGSSAAALARAIEEVKREALH